MLLEELSNVADSLALMGDDQLQAFARTHQGDPYMMALAVTEKNRRATLRSASQQQPMGEQPTVVDQEIAEMAPEPMPEDTGIASLPAPNMEAMAYGGIVGGMDSGYDMAVGYADGGKVERYQNTGLVTAGSEFAIPGMTPSRVPLLPGQQGAPENTPWLQRQFLAYQTRQQREILAKIKAKIDTGTATPSDIAFYNKALSQGIDVGPPLSAAPAPAPATPAKATAAAPAPSTAAAPPPLPPAPAPAAAPAGGAKKSAALDLGTDIRQMHQSFAPTEPREDPFAAQRRELAASEVDAAKKAAEDIEREIRERGVYGEKQEARIKAREEKLAGQEKDLKGLAMFEAGMAILQGGSPNALQNIGQGLMAGSKTYRQGLKDLEAGREKIDDMLARIEDYRRNESSMNAKERRAAQKDIRTAQNSGLRSLIDGAEKTYGMDRDDARAMFQGAIQVRNQQTAAGAMVEAARVRASSDQSVLNDLRGAQAVEAARKNLMAEIVKSMPYAEPAQRQAAFDKRWPEMLRMNPNLAKYAKAVGGDSAPSAVPNFVFNPQTGKIEPAR